MASILAPYNSAMRLGMGFNSFTQQLCINEAVKTKSGEPVPEKQLLKPVYKRGEMTDRISQNVTWTANFVDRISEITDSLNVSGSLEIKCDAIGGGGGASANFVDSNKFKQSDLNYFIQVKVVNERLEAPDLTEFSPLDNTSTNDFTSVYGDSFISGFLEGGTLNALVSIKLTDRSKAKEIGGKLKIAFDAKAVQVQGEAEGHKASLDSAYEGETNISVSCVGGGDIKDEKITNWDLESLRAVAMEFPEKVMAVPMRTSAILTKYTALKSFHEKSVKGSPLDYENAGVYSSALLDAYMDYKVMWRNIQQATWEVEQTQSSLQPNKDEPKLKDMAEECKAIYRKLMEEYEKEAKKDEVAKPLPPNALVPYPCDIFGLEKARRDCRFEMIKIVREVDAVARNPQVASDPDRGNEYLSPAVFRMLLPVVRNLKKQEIAQKQADIEAARIAKMTDDYARTSGDLDSARAEARDLQAKLASAETRIKQLEDKVAKPYNGFCPVPVDKPVFIVSPSRANLVVDLHTTQWYPYMSDKHGGTNQQWIVSRAAQGGFNIRSFYNNNYICTDTTGKEERIELKMTNKLENATTVFFETQVEPEGNVLIRMVPPIGEVRHAMAGSNDLGGSRCCLWPHSKGVNERWRFVPV